MVQKFFIFLLVVTCGFLFFSWSELDEPISLQLTEAEATSVFESYQAAAENLDPKIIEFYFENAKISSSITYPSGVVRTSSMPTHMWITQIGRAMAAADTADGGTYYVYSDITVSAEGKQAVVKANRYAPSRCYWDTNYSMVLEKQADGIVRIVEENLNIPFLSEC